MREAQGGIIFQPIIKIILVRWRKGKEGGLGRGGSKRILRA